MKAIFKNIMFGAIEVVLICGTIVVVPLSALMFLFALATAGNTEQDTAKSMTVAGMSLIVGSGIVLAWVIHRTRRFWMIALATPLVLLVILGLLLVFTA